MFERSESDRPPDDATIAMRRTGPGAPTGPMTGTPTGPVTGASPPTADVLRERVESIGGYRVERELGRGGMGVVYLAEDPRLKRPIAIKVLPPTVAQDREWLARFEREAQLLAALNHPNIATIHSLEEGDGLRFLTLEYIPGANLSDRIAEGALPVDEALAVCRQIAAALEAAHKRGVVHLDMKPQNVRITPDQLAKVLDFGLARAITAAGDAGLGMTEDGTVVGTLGYMSPEQVRGEAVDHRTDVWGLGCVLYECLTGKLAFRGATVREICAATVEKDPDWTALPAELPASVAQALAQALAKRLDARLASAAELRRAIEEGIQERTLALLGAPRRGAEAAPNNLPVQVTSFLGREREQAEIRERLPRTRLLTLAGMGGCGKTRLALEVARAALPDYFDGVWLVELAPLSNPQLLPQAVAQVLGLKEEPNRPLKDTIAAHLKAKKLLLVLDNCEHLLQACAELAAVLLASCPELTILAASREGLGISGEAIYPVPPLGAPPTGRALTVEELGRVESVALFVERAKAVKSGFELGETNRLAVAEVCRRLDGIPLAIELAAARVRVMSAEEIASRLDDRFRLLTGGSRNALPHHQTLRALIDWSYEQLPPNESSLLRSFSTFAGGWTLEAAAAVGGGDEIEEWEVLDLVSRLVDKSLVEMDAEGATRSGRTRYRMLETVRSYARERLKERTEEDPARERHLHYFLALAEEAEPQLTAGEQGLWLARLEVEHDNLRTAADWCRAHPEAPDLGLRLAGALGRFWEVRGHWTEGRETCAALAELPGGSPAHRAKVLVSAGNLALSQGALGQARAAYEESLAIRRELDDPAGIAQSVTSLGVVAWIRGELDLARPLLEEGLAIRRELGDQGGIAFSLHNLGHVARDQGQDDEARLLYEQALALMRQVGHQRFIAMFLHSLGNLLRNRGQLAEARAAFEEGFAIRRELDDRQGIAQSLTSLGQLAKEENDPVLARALQVESLAIKRELGDRRGVVVSLANLAAVLAGQGEHEGAASLLVEGLAIEREIGSRQRVAFLLRELGGAIRNLGRSEEARGHFAESLALCQEAGDRPGIADSLESFALLLADRGEAEAAARLLGVADQARDEAGVGNRTPGTEQMAAATLARKALGDKAFEEALARGRSTPLAEAIAIVTR